VQAGGRGLGGCRVAIRSRVQADCRNSCVAEGDDRRAELPTFGATAHSPGAGADSSGTDGQPQPMVFALDKLLTRALAGMFYGPTSVSIDWTDGPGFVIDLSAVHSDETALPLVMLTATSWLASVLQRDSDRRGIQVLGQGTCK
jgi:hypothetical protein